MKLGMQIGLGPGDIVLDGDPVPPRKGTKQVFSAHVYYGQTVAHLRNCWARFVFTCRDQSVYQVWSVSSSIQKVEKIPNIHKNE